MDTSPENKKPSFDRRRFLGNTLKLALLGTIIPLEQACNNKQGADKKGPGKETVKKPAASKKNNRKKWNHEQLVMNSKTKVLHFPSSRVYTYYDEIKTKHLQEISLATWASQLQEPVRLNKSQSGNILEILAMYKLRAGINDGTLSAATETLSIAFSKECENKKSENPNTSNFRLHELMLQLVTLNKSIPAENKWPAFNAKIKKPPELRKRQKWMETETGFNQRVNYILEHQNDYIARLAKRASKYSFT